MELIMFLYLIFTGWIYASWIWSQEDNLVFKLLGVIWGFIHGWYVTPILIVLALKNFIKINSCGTIH